MNSSAAALSSPFKNNDAPNKALNLRALSHWCRNEHHMPPPLFCMFLFQIKEKKKKKRMLIACMCGCNFACAVKSGVHEKEEKQKPSGVGNAVALLVPEKMDAFQDKAAIHCACFFFMTFVIYRVCKTWAPKTPLPNCLIAKWYSGLDELKSTCYLHSYYEAHGTWTHTKRKHDGSKYSRDVRRNAFEENPTKRIIASAEQRRTTNSTRN